MRYMDQGSPPPRPGPLSFLSQAKNRIQLHPPASLSSSVASHLAPPILQTHPPPHTLVYQKLLVSRHPHAYIVETGERVGVGGVIMQPLYPSTHIISWPSASSPQAQNKCHLFCTKIFRSLRNGFSDTRGRCECQHLLNSVDKHGRCRLMHLVRKWMLPARGPW